MQIRIGPPLPYQFPKNSKWLSIKTLDQQRIIYATLTGIAVGIFIALIWKFLYIDSLPIGIPSLIEIFISLIVLTLGHEIMHLLGFPCFGLKNDTVIGLWPQTASPYVQHLSPLSRDRFLLVSILPFLILSILPLLSASYLPGWLEYLSWISVINCIGVGSDLFIFFLVIRTMSSRSKVVESRDSLCWEE